MVRTTERQGASAPTRTNDGRRRSLGFALALAATAGVLVGDVGGTAQANGWPSPAITAPATVTADALPTVQINGVVWAQAVVGNTVYVGGSFTSARPAGSPLGTNEVPRSNFLAYDITTGALLTSVVLDANAQVRTITASPDGTRVYVGGDFTTFGGQPRNRLAAVSTATNTLVANFAPNIGYHVYDVAVGATAVYAGGNFTNVGTQVRDRLAAFDLNGALLSWAPSAGDREVRAVEVSPDGTRVAIAGQFEVFNGSSTFGRGLALVDAVSGATLPFPAAAIIRNGGPDGGLTSLASDGRTLYGTGYTFGRNAGVLESVFAADWTTGQLTWVSDCHGDTYAVFPQGDAVYTASHSHYCGNIGGFGQPDTWEFNRGLAFSKAVAGTVATERLGYGNLAGQPRPELLNFFPTINAGTFTGLTQGPWSVAGNDRYVVYGGEFTTVNSVGQQGLVRFQRRGLAANTQGPQLFNATYPIKVQSFTAGTVTIGFQANRDRDNATLEYRVYRRAAGTTGNGTLRHTRSLTAPFWNRPVMTWTDSGADVVPGTAYEYRVQVTDGSNFANSAWTAFTVPATGAASAYLTSVVDSEADSLWRLNEPAGATVAADLVGWRPVTVPTTPAGGVTFNQTGAIAGDGTAAQFSGAAGAFLRTETSELPPHTFSLESWFRTPSTANGGLIVGWNQSNTANTGAGSTTALDRVVYLDTAGHVQFGVNPANPVTLTTDRDYRDNEWHHVVGSLGNEGMSLFIDGVLVARRTDVQWARTGYYGFLRIGGGALNGFPNTNATTGRWFEGTVDEVAMYKSVLTADEVEAHYVASGRTPVAPTDAYGAAVTDDLPTLYWRLGEASGAVAADASPQAHPGTYLGGVGLGAAGAVAGTADTAALFNGTTARVSTTGAAVAAPQVYSTELWFRTTSTSGGKLIGFGDSSTTANSAAYDRHLYLQNDGRLVFGTSVPGTTNTNQLNTAQQNRITSATSYNDGTWHHVVATQSAAGMVLYVDGLAVGTHPATQARAYNGFWRVGGDPTWGSASGFLNGAIDEVAVYPVALDATTVFERYVLGAGVVPNLPPAASFTSSVAIADGRTTTVDGSASADTDGTIVSWAWDFGDGSAVVAGASASAQHTYATAGTFTITLTVTDDDGATHRSTGQVTTLAANTLPVAALSMQITGEAVTFDGSASADADGSVVGWTWNFGDGSPTAAGATATHTYAAAGTYAVTLTVTDDRGGSHHIVRSVSTADLPAAPPAPVATLAADHFERSVAGGFGAAETGGAWTVTGTAANYSVSSGRGAMRLGAPGASPSATLASVVATNVSVRADVSVDKAATGGGTYATLVGRRIGTTGDYRATVRFQANGTVQAVLTRRVGATDTTLAVNNSVAGIAATPGQRISVRLEVVGTNPTQLRLKLWAAGTAEPTGWLLTASDATASHQVAGGVGLAAYLSGSATNAPVEVAFDDLDVVDPTVVLNGTPTARFTTATQGLGAAFDASLTVDDGPISGWAWDFGDGRTATGGPTASNVYAVAGTYTVTLTVTDAQGATNQLALRVSVG